ncbi:MAG: hypothetical protein AAGG01_23185 [Planctomycetota bacterium]
MVEDPASESAGAEAQPRLLLVSNRLPVKLTQESDGSWTATRTLGGLATGLAGPHRDSGGVWIGWSGITTEEPEVPEAAQL